jgi:hypothetical protein
MELDAISMNNLRSALSQPRHVRILYLMKLTSMNQQNPGKVSRTHFWRQRLIIEQGIIEEMLPVLLD